MQSLIQIMACRLFGEKPLSEPMPVYCWSGPWKQVSVKLESKHSNFHTRNWFRKFVSSTKWWVMCLGINVLMQKRSNSIADALELRLVSIKLSTCTLVFQDYTATLTKPDRATREGKMHLLFVCSFSCQNNVISYWHYCVKEIVVRMSKNSS